MGCRDGASAYFVHSFVCPAGHVRHRGHLPPTAAWSPPWCSGAKRWGAQFHPERSAATGARLLRNFLENDFPELHRLSRTRHSQWVVSACACYTGDFDQVTTYGDDPPPPGWQAFAAVGARAGCIWSIWTGPRPARYATRSEPRTCWDRLHRTRRCRCRPAAACAPTMTWRAILDAGVEPRGDRFAGGAPARRGGWGGWRNSAPSASPSRWMSGPTAMTAYGSCRCMAGPRPPVSTCGRRWSLPTTGTVRHEAAGHRHRPRRSAVRPQSWTCWPRSSQRRCRTWRCRLPAGCATLDDLTAAKATGCGGIIVGKAL